MKENLKHIGKNVGVGALVGGVAWLEGLGLQHLEYTSNIPYSYVSPHAALLVLAMEAGFIAAIGLVKGSIDVVRSRRISSKSFK